MTDVTTCLITGRSLEPWAQQAMDDQQRRRTARALAAVDENWLTDVLADSIDMDWSPSVGARAIMQALAEDTDAALTPRADQSDKRTIEILRRALAWHGDPQRMATTREDWQQEIDAAIVWVRENPEPGYASFSSFNVEERGADQGSGETFADGEGVPAGCVLVTSKADDDCGCPEEEWETPWGYLFMHLSADKPSDYHLDLGDDGSIETEMVISGVDAARKAGFAWASIAALIKPPAAIRALAQPTIGDAFADAGKPIGETRGDGGEELALRAIKAVTTTTKDAVAGLSRILAVTISAGVKEPYDKLLADSDVKLIVERPRTEWAHLFKPWISGCALPPEGWSCTRERGHTGPCAALATSTGSGS
ncbi:MAG: hypothetical protein JWR85_3604 [Marmoricola sp.]|nr:hypothetical protein [Marmoricola sp.]